jgi:hypothetical protein
MKKGNSGSFSEPFPPSGIAGLLKEFAALKFEVFYLLFKCRILSFKHRVLFLKHGILLLQQRHLLFQKRNMLSGEKECRNSVSDPLYDYHEWIHVLQPLFPNLIKSTGDIQL